MEKEYIAGDGNVGIGAGKNLIKKIHFIRFSRLNDKHEVGEDLMGSDVKDHDITKVYFKNIESLEVLQEAVNSCREHLIKDEKEGDGF